MKTRFLSLFALCGVLGGSSFVAQALETPSAQASVNASVSTSTAPRYSGRINDVVALIQSGVDQSVVLSYIKTSPGPFQPSADEIIKLRDAGVTPDVITAMMQRGAELRDQAVAASAQSQQTYAQSSSSYAQPVPAQTQSWPPPYVDPTYTPSYYSAPSSVVYIGGSYGYPYNYYSPFAYSSFYYPYRYPYYRPFYHSYYPRVGFNFRVGAPFRPIGGGFHFNPIGGGFHGGFRGPIGGGFHGGGFHGGGSVHVGGGFHGGGGVRGGFHH